MHKPWVYVNRIVPSEILTALEVHAKVKIWNGEQQVPRERLLNEIRDAEGLLNVSADRIDPEFLDAAPHLKVISNVSAGYDNLNLPEMNRRGIMGTNVPGILTETTADITFGLLIDAARCITEADRFVRAGQWQGWRPSLFLGKDIYGATLGIVGLGRIGEAVARRAKGFAMKVLYHNRNRSIGAEEAIGCIYVSMDALLMESDFVCILAPALPDNSYIIGSEHLRKMKSTAILINTSRGSNVDEAALIEALQEGRIAGAGLDVFEKEPLSTEHPFLAMRNVVLTPHIGSASQITRKKMALAAVNNLLTALKGERPENLVNPETFHNHL